MYKKIKKKIFKLLNSIKFYTIIMLNKNKKIFIFDLDNTIANTWPSFLQNYKNDFERLQSLSVFFNMKKYIDGVSNEDNIVIILTARPYWSYKITQEWLLQNDIKFSALILVASPIDKIKLLKKSKRV